MRPEPKAAIKIWTAQKGGNTKIRLAVDAHGMPVRMVVTAGTRYAKNTTSFLTAVHKDSDNNFLKS